MTESSLQLTPTSTVEHALRVLDRTGECAAVVMDRGEPVGVVTRVALCGHIGRRPRPSAGLADVMDFEVVGLDPGADEATTIGTFTRAAWRSLRRRRPLADDAVARRRRAFEPEAAARI